MKCERNIVDKSKENPELIHKFMKDKLTIRNQIILLSEGKVIDTDDDTNLLNQLPV